MSALTARSFLFVPGDRPERFTKALSSGADAVILDLEDAVLEESKSAARKHIAAFLEKEPVEIPLLIRTNAANHPDFARDLALTEHPHVVGIVLPKAEPAALSLLKNRPLALYPLIETARGLAGLDEITKCPNVMRLMLGTIDLALDLNLEEASPGAAQVLNVARANLVIASRAAGIAAPVDGVFPSISDASGLSAAARLAVQSGMGGMMCIHPKQITMVHAAFLPPAKDLEWATAVLNAARSHKGAFSFDGKMIDAPVLERARRLLARAGAAAPATI